MGGLLWEHSLGKKSDYDPPGGKNSKETYTNSSFNCGKKTSAGGKFEGGRGGHLPTPGFFLPAPGFSLLPIPGRNLRYRSIMKHIFFISIRIIGHCKTVLYSIFLENIRFVVRE